MTSSIDTSESATLSLSLLTEAGVAISSETVPSRILEVLVPICIRGTCLYAAGYFGDRGTDPVSVSWEMSFKNSSLMKLPLAKLDEHTAQDAGLASVQKLPLIGKGQRMGTLVLGFSSDVDQTMQATLRTVATLAASAIGVAQSHEYQRSIADRLQQAMLPISLPSRNDLQCYSAYLPASVETLVGGDWYDAFEVADGRIAFSLGDVTGHGLEAAIAMVELRIAIRAAAATLTSPSAVLEAVNTVVAHASTETSASAVVGFYDPRTHVVSYAVAGHPPPCYVGADCGVLSLKGGGIPIGIADEIGTSDRVLSLDPGASLVLYTDGLLEYDKDILAGEQRLTETLSLDRITHAENPAAALQSEIFQEKGNTDDVAVLTLRSSAPFSNHLQLSYSPDPGSAIIVRCAIARFLSALDLSEEKCFAILAASSEAFANAVEHGSHSDGATINLTLEREDAQLRIAVENQGHWTRSSATTDERGRGIVLMRAFAHEMHFTSTRTTTIAHLSFDLTP